MVEKLEELHPGELLREEFIQAMGVMIAQVAQGQICICHSWSCSPLEQHR